MAISHCYWHLVVKNGNFTLLLMSSDQEWQFSYWHIVVKNGNFTLLLTSSCQEWQLTDDVPEICQQIYPTKCIMGYILWDVFGSHFVFFKKKWSGISFYFCIIRVINSQLAWYIYVRCNPLKILNTPKHLNTTTWQLQISTMRTHICLICHIVVKVDLGKSPDRCTLTHPQMHHGINIMGCIWQPFWILQERVGISFLFWIMRVVNSQFATGTVMSYVTPLTPPWTHPKWQ